MVDIHTHLLPDFDDGPPTLEHTREMLNLAEKGGTTKIVITPHILNPQDYKREEEILHKFEQVKDVIDRDGRKIKVYLGGEIFLFPDTRLNFRFSTFDDNKKYALIEFGMRQIPDYAPQKLFDLLMEGYKPILAHPERYMPIMKNPHYAVKFTNMGIALQMNSGSLMGVFGDSVKAISHRLIEHKCVHIIASDGHNTDSRSISLAEVRNYVEKTFGAETAEILLFTNPQKAINGEDLVKEDPVYFDNIGAKTSLWQNFKNKLKSITV